MHLNMRLPGCAATSVLLQQQQQLLHSQGETPSTAVAANLFEQRCIPDQSHWGCPDHQVHWDAGDRPPPARSNSWWGSSSSAVAGHQPVLRTAWSGIAQPSLLALAQDWPKQPKPAWQQQWLWQHLQHLQQLQQQQQQQVLSVPCSSSSSRHQSSSSDKEPDDDDDVGGSRGSNSQQEEFGANYGEAVLVLREDLPLLFQQEPRFHIFRDDLTFRTPSLRYLVGLWKYRLLHRAVRWLGQLLCGDLQLRLTRMWQPAANKQQLRVHVCVCGRPWLTRQPQTSEFISTYSFDASGKIYEHQVDTIIPPEAPQLKLLELLVRWLQPGGVSLPQPQLPLPAGLRSALSPGS